MIEPKDYEFLRAFWTRRAVIAYSIFALNFIVFALMTLAGGSDNPANIVQFGAKSNAQIDNGEIWRLVTPIFIHIGLLHLAFNSYALWIIGPQVEKLYGGPRFLLLYILTGIAGVGASYWYHPELPSAGASGAIFGLFGVLLVFSFKYRKTVPEFFSKALSKGMLITVGINLMIGAFVPMIDNSAHLGGFLAGGLLAFGIPFVRPGETERPVFKVVQSALVLIIAASFFQVATHYAGPDLSLRNAVRGLSGGGGAPVGAFVAAINEGQEAFEFSEEVLDSGDLHRLPDVREDLGKAIDKMRDIPSLGDGPDQLAKELLDILQKQYDYVQEVERTGRPRSDFIGITPQSGRYRRLERRIEEWAETEGPHYGIVNTK
jgi:membrane associated rhomboid family serine protease